MQTYILRRFLLVIPTLLIVSVLVFFSLRFIPGDAIDVMVSHQRFVADDDARAMIRKHLGLDLPIHVQYGRWFNGVLQGDLGRSMWTDAPVTRILLEALPVSLEVGLLAIFFSLMIALPVGVYSGIRPDTKMDHLIRSLAIFFICVPSFWIGTMVMIYPSIWWRWSPPMFYVPFLKDPLDNLAMVIIPALILGMWLSGMTMRLMRNTMLEVLRADYVRTAWAKGLRERVVVTRHVLKNSLIPVVTMVGLQLPVLIGGAVVVEYIFGLPGIGRLVVDSIKIRDYPIITGVNVYAAIFVLVINIIIDLSYAWLDPRIRFK